MGIVAPISAIHPCAPREAQPSVDVMRCMARRVSSVAVFLGAGAGMAARAAEAAPRAAPLFRLHPVGQAPLSRRTDQPEEARTAASLPAADIPPVVVATPAVEAADIQEAAGTPVVVDIPAVAVVAEVEATPAVEEVAVAPARVEAAVAGTTNPTKYSARLKRGRQSSTATPAI